MKSKVDLAVETLRGQGHTVRSYSHEGQMWYEVDGILHTSKEEMENLADRVNWLLELDDVFGQRPKEEQEN
jgi:hypothetical protein